MKLKNTLTIFICILLLTSSLPVFANEIDVSGTEILFQESEITDNKWIEKRLNENVNDDKDFKVEIEKTSNKVIKDGKVYKSIFVNPKQTTQKVKEEKIGDVIAVTYVANVSVDNILIPEEEAVIVPMYSGGLDSWGMWVYDNSGLNAKIYNKIYYTEYHFTRSGSYYDVYKISSIYGKYVLLDSSVSVTSLTIGYENVADHYTEYQCYNYVKSLSTSSTTKYSPYNNTSYYKSPTSYYLRLIDNGVCWIKNYTYAVLTRGGSTWTSDRVYWNIYPSGL